MPRAGSYRDVNTHNKLTLQDRVRVLKSQKKNPSYSKLAIEFKCSLHQIRGIVRDKKKILREYVNSKEYLATKYAQSEKAMNSQVVPLLEKVLYEWFQRAQKHIETGPITNEIFLQKADEIKKIFCMRNFYTDLDWLLKFRQKYDITELDMTMLRIGNDDDPLSLDMNEIAMYVVEQNSMSEYLAYNAIESLSDLNDSDFECDNPNETICQKLQLPDQYCNSSNDGSRITIECAENDRADVLELVMPPISNDEQARRHLKPLEDYVLMSENFRAIGLIAQLEEIFNATSKH